MKPVPAQPIFESAIAIARRDDLVTVRQTMRGAARDLGLCTLDQARVVTVVSELARNVLDFAGAGECRIWTRVTDQANQIVLEVEDAGPGIPDVDAALTPRFSTSSGHGLGLPTVKQLVKSLIIESRPGRTLVTALFEGRGESRLLADYASGVTAYVGTGAEHALVAIEDLGRGAVNEGMPFDEIAALHETALRAVSQQGFALDQAEIKRRASTCLSALMIASGVAYRARIDLVEYDRAHAYAERARQRLETLGQLVGGMAHEVSNLLQPIVGLCELSLLDIADDAPERENLDIIAGCAARASGVLRNLLAYGRYAEPEVRLIALGPAIRRSVSFVMSVSMLWPSIGVIIEDDASRVAIVEEELTQILLNLIQNATQAHAKRIEVSVSRTLWRFPAEAANAPVPRRQPALRVAVADDGDGMDGDTLVRASIPFFSGQPPGEGSGMGLAVVGGIVKSWSGQLTLTSQPGEGTTVSVYLPIDKADCATEAA
jgi:signal transduction histidine kinase